MGKKSKLVLSVHDEAILDCDESELHLVKDIVHIMENVYQAEYVPQKCATFIGRKNLSDLEAYEIT